VCPGRMEDLRQKKFADDRRLLPCGLIEHSINANLRIDQHCPVRFLCLRLARVEREARAISALNHPNICTLYDVGANYLVMELVEGETLRGLLKTSPQRLGQAPNV
jgi:serine/threonine protein kinase